MEAGSRWDNLPIPRMVQKARGDSTLVAGPEALFLCEVLCCMTDTIIDCYEHSYRWTYRYDSRSLTPDRGEDDAIVLS